MPQMIRHSVFGWLRHARRAAASGPRSCSSASAWATACTHKPRELSGGEMQRAAIARALISRPRVLLADEPTGNLDEENGQEIVRLLRDLNRREGLTIVMVTHNLDLVQPTDRVVRLTKGRVETAAGEAPSNEVLPLGQAAPLRRAL